VSLVLDSGERKNKRNEKNRSWNVRKMTGENFEDKMIMSRAMTI
jgi:hypothetical protein